MLSTPVLRLSKSIFLKGKPAASLLLSSGLALSAGGCALTGFDDRSLPAKEQAAHKSTKQIVFGIVWEPLGFYPTRAIDSASYFAQTLVFEGLVKYDAGLHIVPGLAESFSVSDDKLTYRFVLRPGLRFSDGSALTAKDVEATLKLATASGSPFRADYVDVDFFHANDPSDFVIHLKKPSAPLLSRLVEMRILPAAPLSTLDQGRVALSRQPISSGPFCLSKWEAGLELTFTPNPYYWGDKPKIDKLIWRVTPDKTLLALALNRKEINVAPIDAQSWSSVLKENRALVLDRFRGSRTVYLGFNLSRPPFDSQTLRQAVGMAIDRESLIKQLYCGFAHLPATDVSPGSKFFNATTEALPYDPARARRSLVLGEEAQKISSLGFKIVTLRDFQEVAEVVSNNLEKVGVKSEVEIVEYSSLKKMYLQSGKFTTFIWSRSSGPDPECTLVWSKKGPLNFCKFDDGTVEKLLEKGRSATTDGERARAYGEIQAVLAKQLPWIFLVQPEMLVAHQGNCKNIRKTGQEMTGLPYDNPLFNAQYWDVDD